MERRKSLMQEVNDIASAPSKRATNFGRIHLIQEVVIQFHSDDNFCKIITEKQWFIV